VVFPEDVETWIAWSTYAPLVVASTVGLAQSLIKAVEFRRARTFGSGDRARLLALVEQGAIGEALTAAESIQAPGGAVVAALLRQRDSAPDLLKERAEQSVAQVVREIEAGLSGLGLVASLGPLFGLFGTVVGITLVFNRLSDTALSGGPEQLAGGISTALYTTIFGLVIGVFALVSHRYFSSRLDRLTSELEALALDVVARLMERRP
jgi:biopolymer transport protein ExbB